MAARVSAASRPDRVGKGSNAIHGFMAEQPENRTFELRKFSRLAADGVKTGLFHFARIVSGIERGKCQKGNLSGRLDP
jgi:hypothetical protein